jgi:hypothetical protein
VNVVANGFSCVSSSVCYLKNNLVQGSGSWAYEQSGTQFQASSGYNLSDDASNAGSTGNRNSITTVQFVNAAAGDYRLSQNDIQARNYGTNLSNDGVLAFSTDIAGGPRVAPWDIGASETTTAIYRSVGPSNTTALATGAGNNMTISGGVATFATALANNIGVGDAIQYDDDNDSDIDANDTIMFIHGRTSSTQYTVRLVNGNIPADMGTADQNWSIFRAYTSLANAETGIENTGIDADLRDFDTWQVAGGRNLVANNEQWNIALYASSSADTSVVDINGWTTGANQYLKVYTPVASSEVGVSQRHVGVWDNSAYRIATNVNSDVINVASAYVRIEGLQIEQQYTYTAGDTHGIDLMGVAGGGVLHVHANLIRHTNTGTTGNSAGVHFDQLNDNFALYATNNIIVGFINGFDYLDGAIITGSVSNNTVVNAYARGFAISGPAGTFTLKNNLAWGTTLTDYSLTAGDATVDSNNISEDATSPNAAYRNKTIIFNNAATGDYRLSASDVSAKNAGADLSVDPVYAFTTDISGATRGNDGTWDIGASEAATAIYRSVGPANTLPVACGTSVAVCNGVGGMTVTSGVATFAGALPANVMRFSTTTILRSYLSTAELLPHNMSCARPRAQCRQMLVRRIFLGRFIAHTQV